MATREEKIAFIQSKMSAPSSQPGPTREEKIAFLQSKMAQSSGGEEQSLLSRAGDAALEGVATAGRFVDKFTGAPTRAAISAAQEGENPVSAFGKQFGEDPSSAPTGKDIARRAGVPDTSLSDVLPGAFTDDPVEAEKWYKFKKGGSADISASGAAGLGLDIVADPINLVPGAALAKGAKGAGRIAKTGAAKTADVLAKTGEKVANVASKTTTKVGSALTGIPEKNIATYIKKTGEVDKVIAKHGGDMTLAADELRENLQTAIRSKISSLNNDVKEAIAKSPAGSFASNEAVIKALDHVKAGINPKLYPERIQEIEELTNKIKGLTEAPYKEMLSPNAQREISAAMSAEAANEAKRFLQEAAKGSYVKGGQLFSSSDEAARAAKAGGREARKIEMKLAPDTIEPNKQLSKLHAYEKNVNKNLLAPGKTESALMAAGSGGNARNAKNLREIGEITGVDALGEAEKLSAAKTFANPSLLPTDATGKSAARMAFAAVTGSALLGPAGSAIGLAFTSPAVLKQAIKAGKVTSEVVSKLAGGAKNMTDEVIEQAVKAANTEKGQAIIRTLEKAPKAESVQKYNEVAESKTRPLKGSEKWANDGFEKLKEQGLKDLDKDTLLSNPKAKKLLIAASDLKPGSKAMNNIVSELEKLKGKR